MAYERLRNSGLTQALTDLLADLGDLVQKEIQLAKAEVTETITSRLRASVWWAGAKVNRQTRSSPRSAAEIPRLPFRSREDAGRVPN